MALSCAEGNRGAGRVPKDYRARDADQAANARPQGAQALAVTATAILSSLPSPMPPPPPPFSPHFPPPLDPLSDPQHADSIALILCRKGDLFVHFKIQFPVAEEIGDEEREMLEKVPAAHRCQLPASSRRAPWQTPEQIVFGCAIAGAAAAAKATRR